MRIPRWLRVALVVALMLNLLAITAAACALSAQQDRIERLEMFHRSLIDAGVVGD